MSDAEMNNNRTNRNISNNTTNANNTSNANNSSSTNTNTRNEIARIIELNDRIITQMGNIVELNREILRNYNQFSREERRPPSQQQPPVTAPAPQTNTESTNLRNYISRTPSVYSYVYPNYYTTTSVPQNRTNLTSRITEQLIQTFLDPINVYPTQSQIENAIRRVRYRDIVSPTNLSCPIILDAFNDEDTVSVIRYCSHIFNTDALNRWFLSNCRCPVCRYDIREYNANYQNNTGTRERNLEQELQEETIEEPIESPIEEESSEEDTLPTTEREETPLLQESQTQQEEHIEIDLTNVINNLMNGSMNADEAFTEIITNLNSMDTSNNLTTPINMFRVLYDRYRI